MRHVALLSLGHVILLAALCLSVPSSASGQVAALQIQVSDADASHQFSLTQPTDWQAAMPNFAPWIIVVSADAIGHRNLSVIESSTKSNDVASGPDSIATTTLPATLPIARIQVANADEIGRFDLQPLGSGQAGNSSDGSNATHETAAIDGSNSNKSVGTIQVMGADAVGRIALSPIRVTSPGATANATATAAAEALPNNEEVPSQAVVIADGKLNVRSGPGQNFKIIGQLEVGTQVTVLKRSDDLQWMVIMDATGLTGWVKAQFMEPAK